MYSLKSDRANEKDIPVVLRDVSALMVMSYFSFMITFLSFYTSYETLWLDRSQTHFGSLGSKVIWIVWDS